MAWNIRKLTQSSLSCSDQSRFKCSLSLTTQPSVNYYDRPPFFQVTGRGEKESAKMYTNMDKQDPEVQSMAES